MHAALGRHAPSYRYSFTHSHNISGQRNIIRGTCRHLAGHAACGNDHATMRLMQENFITHHSPSAVIRRYCNISQARLQ